MESEVIIKAVCNRTLCLLLKRLPPAAKLEPKCKLSLYCASYKTPHTVAKIKFQFEKVNFSSVNGILKYLSHLAFSSDSNEC